jgi:predicted metal-binding protein
MTFSKKSLEILLDLLEIKIATMEIRDEDDNKDYMCMKNCKREILNAFSSVASKEDKKFG